MMSAGSNMYDYAAEYAKSNRSSCGKKAKCTNGGKIPKVCVAGLDRRQHLSECKGFLKIGPSQLPAARMA